MGIDLDALREGLVDQIARIIDPDAHHLGRPEYYGPEPILSAPSARVRVARRMAGAALDLPQVAELIAKAGRVDAAEAENGRLKSACIAVQRSVARFPGSVHDRAMAKIDKALGVVPSNFVDPDEARATAAEAEIEGLRAVRAAMARIVVIQSRELQRMDPAGQTPEDLNEAMADLRAAQTALAALAATQPDSTEAPASADVSTQEGQTR